MQKPYPAWPGVGVTELANGSIVEVSVIAGRGTPRPERERRLPRVAKKRVQFRPPGLKPTTKVGTLGPYRGRLGLAWVIAPLIAGIVILIAGLLVLTR